MKHPQHHGTAPWRILLTAAAFALVTAGGVSLPAAEGDPAGDLPASLEGDPAAIEEGKRIFNVHCWACHGTNGSGAIGPSFQDNETLHGDRYEDMLDVVTNGVNGKPMNAWKNKLTREQILQVVAYVYSLKGTAKEDGGERTKPYTLM